GASLPGRQLGRKRPHVQSCRQNERITRSATKLSGRGHFAAKSTAEFGPGPSLGMKLLDILLSFATCRSLLRLSQAPARPQALDTHPGEEHGNGGQRSRRSDDKHREQNLLGVPPREGDLQPANWFQSNLACSRRNIGFQRPNFLRRSTSAWLTSPAATKACTQVWDRLRPFLSMQVLSAALSSPYSLQW